MVWSTVQSMMMSLMESCKADREEAKREREATARNTARLEGQVQQLQQLLSTGQPGLGMTRTSDPLLTPLPSARPFTTGLPSAGKQSIDGGVRQAHGTPISSVPDPSSMRVGFASAVVGRERGTGGEGASMAQRALFVNPPRVEPPPTPAANVAEHVSEGGGVSISLRGIKIPQPDRFDGVDIKQKAGSRLWLDQAATWMKLTVANQPQETQVLVFSTLLGKDAYAWYTAEKIRAQAERRALTLEDLFASFLNMYAGGRSEMVLHQEFNSLTYGKGRCKDPASTQTEFDTYAATLYPGYSTDSTINRMMGNMYGEIIRRGDVDLWIEAVRSSPTTLDEWKAAVQSAHTIRRTQQMGRTGKGGGTTRTDGHSYWNQQSLKANRVQTRDEGEVAEEVEEANKRQEGQPDTGAAAQAAAVKSPRRKGHVKLSIEVLTQLKKQGRCFLCYAKGHMARDCPCTDDKLPRRIPNTEELKVSA